MRKTTDPKERKYLVDREFNSFGRGAIEDCPAELLYGNGALAEGFNVNCYKTYFEGRTGSRLFSAAKASGGAPMIWEWHQGLRLWVRLEGGQLYTADWDIKEWKRVCALDDMLQSPFGTRRSTFIEDRRGGFIYSLPNPELTLRDRKTGGVFRWIADENVVFRINIDTSIRLKSNSPTEVAHVYRYLFTEMRLRGKSRLEGGIVDYETPCSDHDWVETGVRARRQISSAAYNTGPIRKDCGTALHLHGQSGNPGGPWYVTPPVGVTTTHIGVYRTLDLEAKDLSDPEKKRFNSPNSFALVADVPLTECIYAWVDCMTPDSGTTSYKGTITIREDMGHTGRILPWFGQAEPLDMRPPNKYGDLRFTIVKVSDDGMSAEVVSANQYFGELPLSRANATYVSQVTCGCRFDNTPSNELTWHSNGDELPPNEELLGKPLFLSDGEAYSIIDIERVAGTIKIVLSRNVTGEYMPSGTLKSKYVAACGVFAPPWIMDNIRDTLEIDPEDTTSPTLASRLSTWFPRTRFRKPLPDCNIAAAVLGFVVSAIEGEDKFYYTQDDTLGGYTYGSYIPVQVNDQIKDSIEHIELFPDAVAIFGSRSTWKFLTGVVEYNDGYGTIVPPAAMIPKVDVVDQTIGCKEYRSIRRLSGGEVILLTREAETPAVRIFNGHQYSSNLLDENVLGLSRNKNRVRDTLAAVAIYREDMGYIIWCAKITEDAETDERLRSLTSYCFRLAVRGEQGGGQTEYGGEHWLWPDAGAATVATGYDPDGRRITLVEDARTGRIYQIGVAELWVDREGDGDGSGFEIPTAIFLPTIADGYKWQKHLETHIAMRPWKDTYRGASGFTPDGFKNLHQALLKIFEDGEKVAESSALRDINRNGDYAYLRLIDARRIQTRIETTTSAYKISQVVTKVQSSDREALPADNEPTEVGYQREWRDAIIHLSRNRPYAAYNRADGTEMQGGEALEVAGPFGRAGEAFRLEGGLTKDVAGLTAFTFSAWIRPGVAGDLFTFYGEEVYSVLSYTRDAVRYEHYEYEGADISVPVESGEWVYVALRLSVPGEDGTVAVSLFINGCEAASGFVPASPAAERVSIGYGQDFFDVRLIPAAVSDESIAVYYEAVSRGGEGWLP